MPESAIRARIAVIDAHVGALHSAQSITAPIADAGRRLAAGAAGTQAQVRAVIGGTTSSAEAQMIQRLSNAQTNGTRFAARVTAAQTEIAAALARLARERDHLMQELRRLEAERASRR